MAQFPFWRPALAAAVATGTGIGLARFAYVPIFPALVAAGWVDGGGAGLLGAANLAGYLAGALGARAVARRAGVPRTLDLGMALAVLSFLACAWNLGFLWLGWWRFVSGVSGGLLMGLAGPAMQQVVEPRRRGAAGGIAIGGVGMGIMAASVLVPGLLGSAATADGGVQSAWLGLAGLAVLVWTFAHPRWPAAPVGAVPRGPQPPAGRIVLAYGLSAAGFVPPMVYLADLAVRGRGLPIELASGLWLLFGLGGVIGTNMGGRLADRLGGTRALRLWLAVQVAGLALALPPFGWVLVPAALLSGFAAMGLTAVVLTVARELAGEGAGRLWARTTASFAVAQAVVAFALAWLFAATGESHAAVFGAGLVLSAAALAVGWHPMPPGHRAVAPPG
jgi:predicted MFS family arabinose efflux permease